jgi:hypothetical protein
MSEPVPTAVIPARPSDPAPLSLIHSALERGITDAGYLEKLLDLQSRWEDRNARAAYARAMNACQGEIPAITKDAVNNFTKRRYPTLEAVNRAVQPVYIAHGFSLTFGELDSPKGENWVRIYVDVTHVAGHAERHWGDFPLDAAGAKGGDNKSAIQAVGSAFSYARRYLLGLVFNLVYTDEDTDGAPVAQGRDYHPTSDDGHGGNVSTPWPTVTPEQIGKLLARCQDLVRLGHPDPVGKLCKWLGAPEVAGVRQCDFLKAQSELDRQVEMRKAKAASEAAGVGS